MGIPTRIWRRYSKRTLKIYHRIFYGSEKVIVMLYKENELKIQVEE